MASQFQVYAMGGGWYLSADLVRAASALWVGNRHVPGCDCGGCAVEVLGNGQKVNVQWFCTPYQTADASHDLASAKSLVYGWACSEGRSAMAGA